jgi:hypothetical protein
MTELDRAHEKSQIAKRAAEKHATPVNLAAYQEALRRERKLADAAGQRVRY